MLWPGSRHSSSHSSHPRLQQPLGQTPLPPASARDAAGVSPRTGPSPRPSAERCASSASTSTPGITSRSKNRHLCLLRSPSGTAPRAAEDLSVGPPQDAHLANDAVPSATTPVSAKTSSAGMSPSPPGSASVPVPPNSPIVQ